MKTKKLKRFVCLLLAFVVLLAMPLNTQAHAVALESWVMYAIITGLAAMGITFTVAGGVDAMINAMEEKVDEYIAWGLHPQFLELLLNGIKLIPSPSGGIDPDGNQLRNLFFNALAWDALDKFVDWLTSDGGWGEGDISENYSYSYFLSTNDGGEYYEPIYVSNTELISSGTVKHLRIVGTPSLVQIGNNGNNSWNTIIYNPEGYRNSFLEMIIQYNPKTWTVNAYGMNPYNIYESWFPDSYTSSDIIGYTIVYLPNTNPKNFAPAIVFSDNTCISPNITLYADESAIVNLEEKVEILVPEDIPRLTPEQTQGVIMQQLEIGSPEIQEWARQVEELFIETGTIPQPQPEVITDPATQPVPTPAPTAPPIQDVDDLGLPTLGEAVFNKFPFSLPRDLKRIAEILNAEPVTPYWEVDLFAPLADDISFAGDTTLRIDLTEYEALGQISRWASVIGFCIMLIIITKGVIKW